MNNFIDRLTEELMKRFTGAEESNMRKIAEAMGTSIFTHLTVDDSGNIIYK